MLAEYRENGFYIKKRLISRAVLDAVIGEYIDIFAGQLRVIGKPARSFDTLEGFAANLKTLLDDDPASYVAACKLCQHSFSVHRLSLSREIETFLGELGLDHPVINSRPVCHFTNNLLKIPGGYHKSPPHQDWRSMQGSIDSVVLWIPLTDIDINGHPIEVVPGSHKLGLLETRPHVATPEVVDPRIRDEDFVPVLCDAGDVIAFSSFMVHRSMDKGDDQRVRFAISLRYNNLSEPSFVARHYPNPYSYKYQLDIIYPEFDTKEAVGRLFGTAPPGKATSGS